MRRSLQLVKPIRVEKKVSTRLEIASYLRDGKPVLFENIDGYPGFRIAGNLYSSRESIAKVLGMKKETMVYGLLKALDSPRKYEISDSADFFEHEYPAAEIIKHVPLVMYYKRASRYYTSATIVFARDPASGRQNASFHRMMYLDGNRFSIRIAPRDLYSFFMENKERGRDTEIAVACGVNPAVALAAATSFPDLNELELANSLLGGKLRCVDLDGFDIPTTCEVVMVGRILHDQTAEEGPFVDLTGTWDKIRREPVVEIERIYTRDRPIWQVILPGGSEHRLLMGLPQEPRMLRIIQNAVPSVKNVVLTSGGCCWLHAVVSIKKRVEGDGRNAGMAALAAHPSLKRVVVVDDDIDITDPESVEWALATRLQPSDGIVLIPGARGSSLDPSSREDGVTTKWLIDATIPADLDKTEFMKAEDVEIYVNKCI